MTDRRAAARQARGRDRTVLFPLAGTWPET
jgi:hypothetical protein